MHVGAETLHGAWWVWEDGCELVGKWFAGCVGWCVGLLVPTTSAPLTNHQHFSVKRCASAQNPWAVGVLVTKWKKTYPGVINKHVIYVQKQLQMKKINNTHQQLHQVQTKISSFYDNVLYILLLYRFELTIFPSWKRWVDFWELDIGERGQLEVKDEKENMPLVDVVAIVAEVYGAVCQLYLRL